MNVLKQDPVRAAKGLLGMRLCRQIGNKIYKYEIVETEAYGGPKDLASHARHGETNRNAPMWAEAGTLYVYFTYGMHYMLNFVTGKKDEPGGVLIRGLAGISGPGRITKALKIDTRLSGKKLGRKTGLWLQNNPALKNKKLKIKSTPRIGVAYAGPIWSKKFYRFVLEESNKA